MIDLIEVYRSLLTDYPFLMLLIVGGTMVLLLGLTLQKLAARSSAAQRHLILAATMVALLAIPIVNLTGPQFSLPILPPAAAEPSDDALGNRAAKTETGSVVVVGSSAPGTERVAPPAVNRANPSLRDSLLLVYVAGVVIVLMPLVVGSLRMRWIIRRARPLVADPDLLHLLGGGDVENGLRMLTSESITVPLAWGWRRPVLLLPAEALEWPRAMQRDAIIHELGHLDRRDLWSQTVARVAAAVHWFNPLTWAVLRRLLLEAEQACDDRVLKAGTQTADYAERLLKIASDANHRSLRGLSAVAMARSSQLATRIESLFESSRPRAVRLSAARTVGTLLLLILPAALIGAVQVEQRPGSNDSGGLIGSDQPRERLESGRSWEDEGDADNDPLYAAVRYGNRAMVESILDAGADPNARWDGDGTPLIIAVRHGRDDVIDLLLERGARPDEGVEGDGNALIVAAERGDMRNLETFIATGADIDRGVPGDGNPLIAAAGAGQLEAMKLLVANGADIEAVVPGDENPLIKAAEHGELEAARYLISVGADVNARVVARSWRTGEVEVRTPLSRARHRGDDELVRLLISAGARD